MWSRYPKLSCMAVVLSVLWGGTAFWAIPGRSFTRTATTTTKAFRRSARLHNAFVGRKSHGMLVIERLEPFTTRRRQHGNTRAQLQSQGSPYVVSRTSSSSCSHRNNCCISTRRHLGSTSTTTALLATGTPVTPFDDGVRPFQITTPIYYVNDKPHIGHAYTSTACDVIARYMRMAGRQVFFLSGTDEHGQKVEQSAFKQGLPPQDFVDTVSVNFRDMLSLLHISNDCFIRTTQDDHKAAVQHLWQVLVDNGHIYLGNYEGWYSVRDECFYTESELVDGKAPTGAEVEWVAKEQSYFFRLSQFQDRLLDLYERNPDFIAPESRRKEVVSFVKGGLRDLSISRTSFKWGVPVPGDDNHVMYVWIDALTNYISALGYPNSMDGDRSTLFHTYWPAALHVVGKDILRFHAVYWPAMLMAADLALPKRLFAHGWWTKDGQKISKSIGNVIDPVDLVEKYGVDPTRFFLMSEVNFGNDGDFSDQAMITKVNTNLANELGNLCQRTLTMVYKNCNQQIPTPGKYTDEDQALLDKAAATRTKTDAAISVQAIHKYVEAVVSLIWDANKYIDTQAPWALRKTDPDRMGTVLYVVLEVLRQAAILYKPLIPESADRILDMLNVSTDKRTFAQLDSRANPEYCVPVGSALACQPIPIFPRIEMAQEKLVQT